ncbi:histidine phosphatase family protein [Halorientalis pallida]|uniref:Histidine phosphatase family protein n=1 Tax=Halorientalis pallida TaxID=2479928 RepID=A0A498KQF1_9EURY|nr:histidine phosphatase family protein [Halorientalis pallida]RXK46407.1 histidine phosphatase family protein [Halorientalis pallida]
MTTVVVVRHGETEWNREGRIQGWAASPLNERGRRQGRAVGRHLDDTYDLDAILASDLRRTRETTAHLRSAGEFPEPEFTEGWRERSFGAFQGLTYEQVFSEFPEHRASVGMVGLENTPEGGESLLEARERVLTAWDDLLEEADPDGEVLVVTHGGPIYVLLAHLREMDLPTALTNFSQGNCAVNELEHDHETGETEILRENETAYQEVELVE